MAEQALQLRAVGGCETGCIATGDIASNEKSP